MPGVTQNVELINSIIIVSTIITVFTWICNQAIRLNVRVETVHLVKNLAGRPEFDYLGAYIILSFITVEDVF